MQQFKRQYKLEIRVCAPVHIGSSSDFELANYIIFGAGGADSEVVCPECGYRNSIKKLNETGRCLGCDEELFASPLAESNCLYTFTPKQLASAVDRRRLLECAKSDNIMALQKFFRDNADKIAAHATKRARVASEIAKEYKEKFGNIGVVKNEQNLFRIARNVTTGAADGAYIPGSSLKGAIRTALLSTAYERHASSFSDNAKIREIEKTLAGGEFARLKIGDALPVKSFMTDICKALNVKRRYVRENANLSVYVEAIPAGTGLTGAAEICDSPRESEKQFSPVAALMDMEKIRLACNKFYLARLREKQESMVSRYGVPAEFFTRMEAAAQKPDTFIVCLGKYGGAENVTVAGLRRIKIKGKKGEKPRDSDVGTTYWLASDGNEKMPFGWCVVKISKG